MTRFRFIIPALLMAVMIWGCTRPTTADGEKSRSLEARVAKLEQELKTALTARDQVQQKLTSTETKLASAEGKLRQEEARAKLVEQERDEARASLKVRTTERDALQIQYEAFRKTIRELVGQADTAATKPTTNGSTVSIDTPAPPPSGL